MENDKTIRRSGPRFTIAVDFNLQWLTPTIHGREGVFYFHLGWISGIGAFGKARDIFYDALGRGLGVPKR